MRILAGLCALFVVALGLAQAPGASAQTWPDRPVRILVPFAPGGNSDVIARLAAQHLSDTFGQQFVVENRPGASGALAVEAAARAPADGYTLLAMALPQAAVLPAMAKVKYDSVADFAAISNIGFNTYALTVHPSVPARTPAELIAHIKAKPGLTYAAAGPASHANLAMVLLMRTARVEVAPVHLRGGSEAIGNVVGGHIPMGFLDASEVIEQAKAGSVRLLAVTSKERIPQLPDVPTMRELGFKEFVVATWTGLVAPAGTPTPIVSKLASAMQMAAQTPALTDRLLAMGVVPIGDTPEEFADTIKQELGFWGGIVLQAGLQDKEK